MAITLRSIMFASCLFSMAGCKLNGDDGLLGADGGFAHLDAPERPVSEDGTSESQDAGRHLDAQQPPRTAHVTLHMAGVE